AGGRAGRDVHFRHVAVAAARVVASRRALVELDHRVVAGTERGRDQKAHSDNVEGHARGDDPVVARAGQRDRRRAAVQPLGVEAFHLRPPYWLVTWIARARDASGQTNPASSVPTQPTSRNRPRSKGMPARSSGSSTTASATASRPKKTASPRIPPDP